MKKWLLITLFSANAQAAVLFEPVFGYSMGNFATTALVTNAEQNARIDGFTYGGRLGWTFGSGIFIGGEYQAGRMNYKLDGTNDAINWSNETIFGLVGFQSLMGLRLFAGMNVQPHKSVLNSTPVKVEYSGSAKKVGIGYRYRIPLAMNAEYIIYEISEKSLYSKVKYDAVMLSLSFPFGF